MSFIPFTEKNEEEKYWNLLDWRLDPDPLSRKRIRNTVNYKLIENVSGAQTESHFSYLISISIVLTTSFNYTNKIPGAHEWHRKKE